MNRIPLHGLSEPQRQAWRGLLDVAAILPDGWCVVGGQMVFLICRERSASPARPTDDGDVVLDVRARPGILSDFTAALVATGFTSAGESMEGHQHRWIRGSAAIDVLIPGGVGAVAASRRGATGATTLQAPGAQQALRRSEPVEVQVGAAVGVVRRPNMLGALVAKAAAFSVPSDPHKHRHVVDFATLAAIASRQDHIAEQITRSDRRRLRHLLDAAASSRPMWVGIPGAERGIQALFSIVEDPTP